ncbi:unnamed protein product [Ixodes persulcatus]
MRRRGLSVTKYKSAIRSRSGARTPPTQPGVYARRGRPGPLRDRRRPPSLIAAGSPPGGPPPPPPPFIFLKSTSGTGSASGRSSPTTCDRRSVNSRFPVKKRATTSITQLSSSFFATRNSFLAPSRRRLRGRHAVVSSCCSSDFKTFHTFFVCHPPSRALRTRSPSSHTAVAPRPRCASAPPSAIFVRSASDLGPRSFF